MRIAHGWVRKLSNADVDLRKLVTEALAAIGDPVSRGR